MSEKKAGYVFVAMVLAIMGLFIGILLCSCGVNPVNEPEPKEAVVYAAYQYYPAPADYSDTIWFYVDDSLVDSHYAKGEKNSQWDTLRVPIGEYLIVSYKYGGLEMSEARFIDSDTMRIFIGGF